MTCRFSVVVALAPERDAAEVLKSLKKVDYPKNNYEIIVEVGRNPSNNRNRGAVKAKGRIIAFIDDDAVVDKHLLKNAESFFRKYKSIEIVGGPQLTPKDERWFPRVSGYVFSSKFGMWEARTRYGGRKLQLNANELHVTSANLLCKRKVFKKIKFNPKLFPGEDPDFIAQGKKVGFRVAYSPELKVYHRRRDSLFGLVKQIFSYGKFRPIKESLKETLKERAFFVVPSLFLMYIIFIVFYVLLFRNANVLLFLPLILYVVMSVLASLVIALRKKDLLAIFVLPLLFFVVHFSYGAGFLLSTAKKICIRQ